VDEHHLRGFIGKRDRAHCLDALLVREVPAAAHDAVLQELRPRALELHAAVVVRLDREEVDAAQEVDERVGHAADIGREAEAAGVGLEAERHGARLVVRVHARFDADRAELEAARARIEGLDPRGGIAAGERRGPV
jgi:hypothetical protein